MAKYEAGFIGAGNMGGALAAAAVKTAGAERVAVACSSAASSEAAARRIGCRFDTAAGILAESRFVFLGVKPNMIESVVSSLSGEIMASDCVFVSMLAGVNLERLGRLLGSGRKVIRIMPNTPCAVGSGVLLMCANALVSSEELAEFYELMCRAGTVDAIDEGYIDAASALSGCGPAYAYMFIEALADGAVKCGLPRDKAISYAAQTLLGSAEMVLKSGKHPEKLKDEVCSPGGSTIEGVYALERSGFRAGCVSAVDAAFEKTKRLG